MWHIVAGADETESTGEKERWRPHIGADSCCPTLQYFQFTLNAPLIEVFHCKIKQDVARKVPVSLPLPGDQLLDADENPP